MHRFLLLIILVKWARAVSDSWSYYRSATIFFLPEKCQLVPWKNNSHWLAPVNDDPAVVTMVNSSIGKRSGSGSGIGDVILKFLPKYALFPRPLFDFGGLPLFFNCTNSRSPSKYHDHCIKFLIGQLAKRYVMLTNSKLQEIYANTISRFRINVFSIVIMSTFLANGTDILHYTIYIFVTAPSLGVFLKRSYKRDKKNKIVCKRESKNRIKLFILRKNIWSNQ
ncbi:hypothetical protein BpHYR1_016352 [Brachionus plicatilis]|uniref:Uncharacterized protein n=1 Tax=Brachionus plicatilis TaxID=10195 RepID=A0A3M7R119_BRAPC|nr:hypothetical protein BpHYR1_016352 [Brachionus plicatilis]